ncbi:MarR family winged helix-turn-helix transcriptional regulator, partial [Enterococcus faecalis]|uniref:MarR family winged helix-turn-helix transcriptional regulator n=1 Tax=Enterococcus faecalis TaxID=1351 RepID=UPI000A347F77
MTKEKNIIIGKKISKIYEKMLAFRSKEIKNLNINPNDYNYFLTISEYPGCNQNFIAKKRNVNKSYVTRIVNKYEKQDLLKKIPSESNKSAYSIYLTESGKNLVNNFNKVIYDLNEFIVSNYSDEEYEDLIIKLEKLLN